MKKTPLGLVALTFVVSAFFVSANWAYAQSNDGGIVSRALSATVDFGNNSVFQPAKSNTTFERLGLLPQQLLTITVQFPAELAGQIVIAEPLDGGTLSMPDGGLFIGSDGAVTFQFQAGNAFGACRVAVHQPDDSNFIQLWVVDPAHPENTPPDLPGVY